MKLSKSLYTDVVDKDLPQLFTIFFWRAANLKLNPNVKLLRDSISRELNQIIWERKASQHTWNLWTEHPIQVYIISLYRKNKTELCSGIKRGSKAIIAFSWSNEKYLKELALCNCLEGGFKSYYYHPKILFFHGITFCVFILYFSVKNKIYASYSPVLASKSWRLFLSSLGSAWVLLLTSEGTGLDFNTTSGAFSRFSH